MHPLIEENLEAIRALCREYGIEKLEVFGSVMTDEFREDSDVDFIVHLPDGFDYGSWGSRFFSIEERLAEILGRDVDVISTRAGVWTNRYFRRESDKTRSVLYDASEIGSAA